MFNVTPVRINNEHEDHDENLECPCSCSTNEIEKNPKQKHQMVIMHTKNIFRNITVFDFSLRRGLAVTLLLT